MVIPYSSLSLLRGINHPFLEETLLHVPNQKLKLLPNSQLNVYITCSNMCVQYMYMRPTADSLFECCILLKSRKGLSPPHGTDIWAKYLGIFLRYPAGKTLSGRQKVACSPPQEARGLRTSQGEQEGRVEHAGTCLQVEFSKASLISSSLELALLLLPVSGKT